MIGLELCRQDIVDRKFLQFSSIIKTIFATILQVLIFKHYGEIQ